MTPLACVTTSWDDGHPLDLRVADLLARHGQRGTFYVPRRSERGTMTPADLRALARGFEIGGHTLDHVVLTELPDLRAREEIAGSKRWIEDGIGAPCHLFCPPKGQFSRRHLSMMAEAGYGGVRTVELASLDSPRRDGDLLVLPTSVQVFAEGRAMDFVRNAVKRRRVGNLWRFLIHGRTGDWLPMARSLLRHTFSHGGVFHLWGHSWELDAAGQWQRLEDVLRLMSDLAPPAAAMTNGEICKAGGTDTRTDTTSVFGDARALAALPVEGRR